MMKIHCCPTCHGNYPARIIEVINGVTDCPYCSGRKALPGKISFAALHSDLMEDWDFIANYYLVNPDKILDAYSQKVWWNCKRSSDHKYPLSPADKVFYQKRHRESCPYCKGRRRKKIFLM
ncbi:zinc-ribbon domain-containing protein [Coprococcus sp. AM100_B19A]|uniref:zinc-ribbon domain-containing protein n=2 Tax=unclassified Coprococcus TaxID=2684943 RepID=UPI003FA4522D